MIEAKININNIEVVNFLKEITRKQKSIIDKGLKRVSNMAVLMITKRTQAGKLPDGGNMRPYARSTVKGRNKRGRQTGFVDLTDSGKMFRSLDFRTGGMKSTLFFSNMERAKIASYHDSFGVGKKKVKDHFLLLPIKKKIKYKQNFLNFILKK